MDTERLLVEALRARRISLSEVDRAFLVLTRQSAPFASLAVTRVRLLQIAVYLNPLRRGVTYYSRYWQQMVDGHPAALAIYVHEAAEIETLSRAGHFDLEALSRSEPVWWHAHATACWREAEFWAAWAESEGEAIPAAAFLLAHPERRRRELETVIEQITVELGAMRRPSPVELAGARAFYARKGLGG
jgi:hypothetical protein